MKTSVRMVGTSWILKIVFCSILFCACQSPSDQILKAFKTVDSSIARSNRNILAKNDYRYYYLSITEKHPQNKDQVQKADDLYKTMQFTIALIERTQATLREKDSIGDNQQIATKLLVHTPLGDSIRAAILNVALRCREALVSPDRKAALDSTLEQSVSIVDAHQWNEQQFVNEPSAATQMTLEYLKLQCNQAAILTFRDIDDPL